MSNKEKNIKAATAVFENNDKVKQLYFTNDGQAFYDLGPALAHQREIGGKKGQIHLVKNGNFSEENETIAEDTVSMNDAAPAESTVGGSEDAGGEDDETEKL